MGRYFCIGLLKLSQSYSVKLRGDYFKEPQLTERQSDFSISPRYVLILQFLVDVYQ